MTNAKSCYIKKQTKNHIYMYACITSPTGVTLILFLFCAVLLIIVALRGYYKEFLRKYRKMKTCSIEDLQSGQEIVVRKLPRIGIFKNYVVQYKKDYEADIRLGKMFDLTNAFFLNTPKCVRLKRANKNYLVTGTSHTQTRSRLVPWDGDDENYKR